MDTPVVQRWRDRVGVYRPAREPFNPRDFEVTRIDEDRVVKDFVLRLHYSGSYPAAIDRWGLFRRSGGLAGVAVLAQPMNDGSLRCLGCPADTAAELGRFVLEDDVAANAESWFLAEVFRQIAREGIEGLVSFADPMPRATSSGDTIFPGHIGTIYQALNARFLGRATPRSLLLLPDGTALSPRVQQKIRAMERGWEYGVRLLERHGAPPFLASDERDARAWLRRAVSAVCRPMRHPGTLKYAFAFTKATKRHLPSGLSYPKFHTLPQITTRAA